jgi:Fe-Mn family superoxide dismutase
MAYEVPRLTYDFGALEPTIDAQTMQLHHDKHHGAYVSNLNAAVDKHRELFSQPVEDLLRLINEIPEDIRTAVRNHGGGHANRTMFWTIMQPQGGGAPTGPIAEAITSVFGSFASLQTKFNEAGAKHFGSGWVWLAADRDGRLQLLTTANQDSPFMQGLFPILGNDVWEHAYYLKFTHRPDGAPLVKVLDFGISKAMHAPGSGEQSLTQTRTVMGSPEYMSPEQVRSARSVDARTDVWAFGIILYQLLAGAPPFEDETVLGVCARVLTELPPPLRVKRPDAPPDLEAVVAACLEKDLGRRLQSVGALARALHLPRPRGRRHGHRHLGRRGLPRRPRRGEPPRPAALRRPARAAARALRPHRRPRRARGGQPGALLRAPRARAGRARARRRAARGRPGPRPGGARGDVEVPMRCGPLILLATLAAGCIDSGLWDQHNLTSGEPCGQDDNCASHVCRAGRCQVDEGALGLNCASRADCDSESCVDRTTPGEGLCYEPCDTTACPDGSQCVGAQQTGGAYFYWCALDCASNADCDTNGVCEAVTGLTNSLTGMVCLPK